MLRKFMAPNIPINSPDIHISPREGSHLSKEPHLDADLSAIRMNGVGPWTVGDLVVCTKWDPNS